MKGHIVKAVAQLNEKGKLLPLGRIWSSLVDDSKGYIGHKPARDEDRPCFGMVTKQEVGYRLREALALIGNPA